MRRLMSWGFWVVLVYPFVVMLLSALGFTNHVVWGVGAFGILPFLRGALAWRRGKSKNCLLLVLALVLSVPLTRWPLQLSLAQSQARLQSLETKALFRATEGLPSVPQEGCLCGLSTSRSPDNDGNDTRSDSAYPWFAWIVRYPVTSSSPWLAVREIRLWHQQGGYTLVEFPTRFGVVVQHRWANDHTWHWELGEER